MCGLLSVVDLILCIISARIASSKIVNSIDKMAIEVNQKY